MLLEMRYSEISQDAWQAVAGTARRRSHTVTNTTTITLQQRRAILRSAGQPQANIAIEIIPGVALAPRSVGESYYWTTPSGKTIVHHPSAYRWPTWYHASTRRVIVGEIWAAQA